METKTFDELKQMAIQIRDEKTNKQNTANRIGTEMLEHLDKLEQDYYDKTTTDEELKKRDDKLTELSSDLSLEMELINNSMSAASPIYFPIEGGIKSGDKLRIVFSGLSSDKDCAAFLCDSKITIASEAKQILFDGHPGNIDGIYTANVDANGIQLYSENSSNVIVYNYKITNLKKGYSKLNNEIGNINDEIGNINNNIFYYSSLYNGTNYYIKYYQADDGIKKGDTIKIKITGIGDSNQCGAFLVDSYSGPDPSDTKQILFNGHLGDIEQEFTANVDANGVQIYTSVTASLEIYVSKYIKKGIEKINNEIGNINDEIENINGKIGSINDELSLEMELINNSMSAASPIYFPIEGGIKSGDKLRIVFSGLSSDKDCAAFLCDSKITIASEAKQILFDGHPGDIDEIYTANVDANGIQLYSENSSNVIVYKLTNLKEGYSKLNNEIGNINNQDKKAERPAAGYENFSVKINYADEDNLSNSTNVQAGKNFKTDYGVIALPQNYTPNGTPTRLIIFCQGTGERITDNTNPMNNFGWQYFIKKGYAVLDMNGMSTEWGEEKGFPITNQHYSNKYIIQSYTKGYNYVITKYNLYKETFVLGLSMGGSAMLMISQTGNIPILACAGFAPTISVYKNNYMKPWNGENQKRTIAGQWNFDNWESATLDQLYFISNLSKITGYDNLMINTFGDTTDIDTANNNYDNDEEKNAYYRLQKYFPHPLKIWHCDDDSTVLIRYADFFVKMINNAGGRAWLRRFPTGGHSGGWNTRNITDTDYDGSDLTCSINLYELMIFFQQYE